MAPHWQNWARTARANPTRIETPSDTAQLAEIVTRAAAAGERVRAVGGGVSTNAIAAAPGVMVDSGGMRGLRRIDRERGTATFGAGTRVAEAAALLEAEGLSLLNPTSNTGVTLAGSAATGSQGSSLRRPSASNQLVEATLVTGQGEVLRVGERSNAELWPAVKLGLGAVGIMSEVTVRTGPQHSVTLVESNEPLRRVLDHFEERASAVDHFSVRWMPHTDTAHVHAATNTPGAALDGPEPGRIESGLNRLGAGLRIGLVKSFPPLIPLVNRVTSALQRDRMEETGPVGALAGRPAVPYASMQYAFPLADLPGMVRELKDLIESRRFHVPFRVLLTVAPADEAWLSTSYGRATGSIGLAMPQGIDPRPLFHEAEAMFLAGGGLPHWSGYHTVRAAEFAHVMPRFGDFLSARDHLDPERRFENGYLRRVLGA